MLEHFDEQGVFHATEWDPLEGMIERSARFDDRNKNGTLAYTSIIIDAIKPTAPKARCSS
jgi:predicted SAM-dependent methyltransferase